jgi:hypothetical protein
LSARGLPLAAVALEVGPKRSSPCGLEALSQQRFAQHGEWGTSAGWERCPQPARTRARTRAHAHACIFAGARHPPLRFPLACHSPRSGGSSALGAKRAGGRRSPASSYGGGIGAPAGISPIAAPAATKPFVAPACLCITGARHPTTRSPLTLHRSRAYGASALSRLGSRARVPRCDIVVCSQRNEVAHALPALTKPRSGRCQTEWPCLGPTLRDRRLRPG